MGFQGFEMTHIRYYWLVYTIFCGLYKDKIIGQPQVYQ